MRIETLMHYSTFMVDVAEGRNMDPWLRVGFALDRQK